MNSKPQFPNASERGPKGRWGSWLPPAFPWVLRSDCQSAPYLVVSLALLVTAPLCPPRSPHRRQSLKGLFCRLQGDCDAIFPCLG